MKGLVLRLHQFNGHQVGIGERPTRCQHHLLRVQIQRMLGVAVKVDLEAASERVLKRDGLGYFVVARDECVTIILAREPGGGAVVFEQVVEA